MPLSLGIADGIFNALTLASATVLHGDGLDASLALRVGVVAFVSALFTVFVAEYAQLRSELARAERELSLTASGRLAAGYLGRQVAKEAFGSAAVASFASFVGAVSPLLIGSALHGHSWSALPVALAALAVLGAALATVVSGHRVTWVVALVLAGAIVSAVGVALDIT